ncbi:MAG TPA: ABC transporter permease subunit [Acidimicrobiales bacterium]|nr:ABC transporter permease subunit [Acidimicrobiales bacterium]
MQPRSVATKTVHDHGRGTMWWALSVAAFVAMESAIYPSIRHQAGFQDTWRQLPDAMKALFGLGKELDFTTGTGFLQAEVFGFMLPLAFIGYAIALGGRAIGREEDRGTLDLLLAYPVRRGRVVVQKHLAGVAMTVALGVAVFVTLVVADELADMRVPVARLASVMAGVVAVGLCFGAVALVVTCIGPSRGVAYAAASVAALAAFLVNSLASITSVVRPVRPLSPFRWALGDEPLRTGFHAGLLVPVAIAAVLLVVAAWAFERRDIAT